MPKALARLLDQPHRLVTKAIAKLEAANGYQSEDVRQLAENTQAVRAKLSDLGLDPDDTTGEELYQALVAKFEKDSRLIDKALGINSQTDFNNRIDKTIQLIGHLAKSGDSWVLKHAAAKKLLREQSPKKLMKKLNYRSVESLLKRQDIGVIYLTLPYTESSSWQKTFAKQLAKVGASEYELRSPEIGNLPSGLSDVKGPDSLVASNIVTGAVGLWPSAKLQKARVLSLALILLGGLENLTHSETASSIAHLHPALSWWDQSKQLLAGCGDEVVSLNYQDIALDHLADASYSKRGRQHGQMTLWNALAGRYRNDMATVGETWTAIENDASEEFNRLINRELTAKPAVEYQEIIADEF